MTADMCCEDQSGKAEALLVRHGAPFVEHKRASPCGVARRTDEILRTTVANVAAVKVEAS